MKLVVKLLIGFIVIASVVLVVGYSGLIGARNLSSNIRQIADVTLPGLLSLQSIQEAQTAFDAEENGLMGKNTEEADIREASAMLDAARKRQDDAMKVYAALPRDREENELWEKLVPALDSFWKAHLLFMNLEKQFEQTRSKELFARMKTLSIEVEDPLRDAVGEILDKEIALNRKKAADAVAQAEATSARVQTVAVIGLAAGPLVALLLGVLLALSITRPIAKGVAFAQRIAGGDLTQQLRIHRRDELGTLATALNGMTENLRGMVASVQSRAHRVAAFSQEITASAQKLSEGAQSQAANLQETSASIEELTASADQVAAHALSQSAAVEQGTASMTQVQKSAEEVSKSLARISDLALNSVENAVEGATAILQVVEGINLIEESSERIGGIVSVISEIAEQTNLLSLNASIEAARAGEHGRGFAVVADEVSKLADRSAASTKEIEGLIKESVGKVNAGVNTALGSQKAMEKIRGASLTVKEMIAALADSVREQVSATHELVAALSNVNEMSEGISAATFEQTASARQVSKAVERVTDLTQSAASSAEEMSAATTQLSMMAEELQKLMAQFRIEDGIGNHAHVTAVPREIGAA
jgi:methyl-accepting chemotaxis protein